MRELFKESCKITNYNIILAVPLIVGIKILDLYTIFSRLHIDSNQKLLLATVTLLFMSGVFCALWFYMVKGAVDLSKKVFVLDTDRANATLNLFKTIPEGIGKFFLSFVGVYVILFFIQIFLTPIVYLIGANVIGALDDASSQQLLQIASDPTIGANTNMATFVEQLTPSQIMFFCEWSLLFMLATSVVMYLLMLWIPEIIYKTPNPLVALFRSIGKLFKDFWKTLGIFVSLWFAGFVLLFIYTFAVIYPIFYILVSIIMYYFIVYMTVLIFLYYDKKYVDCDEK